MTETVRTPEKDDVFIEMIAGGGIVVEAADKAGYSRSRVYDWRKTDTAFAARWEQAVESAIQLLEKEADRRAYRGVERKLYHAGKPIMVKDADGVDVHASVFEHSDTLLIFRLKALRPEVYRERTDMKADVHVTFGLADRLERARQRALGLKKRAK